MREQVKAAAEALRAHGDGNIMYVDGLKLKGPEDTHLRSDEVQPSPEGYQVMAGNSLREVAPALFGQI